MKYTIDRKAEDLAVVKYINSHGINIESNTKNLSSKIKFLIQEMGWKGLRVSSESGNPMFKSLYECSPERISATVRKTYNSAKKRLDTKIVTYEYPQLKFNFQQDIDENEKKRLDALANQNAIDYYNQCNILGLEPEDEYLYDRGIAEIKGEKNEKL